jgi:hypothetical protein
MWTDISSRSLPVTGVILWILTLWPTESKIPAKRYTIQSCTCEVTDLTFVSANDLLTSLGDRCWYDAWYGWEIPKVRRVIIIGQRTWIKVLYTCYLNNLLFVEDQLLKHPWVVRLSHVCFPRFPLFHHLLRNCALRRWHDRSRIPRPRQLLISHMILVKVIERW